MNKAFIFDMDGVIVNSEKLWEDYEQAFLHKVLGKKIAEAVGDTIGVGVKTVYDKATQMGFQMDREAFQSAYDQMAFEVYKKSKVTAGLNKLVSFLTDQGFRLGVVSMSPSNWLEQVLPRLSFRDKVEVVISLDENEVLKPKPYPDGYKEAMRVLGAVPKTTMVLEDSNTGIASGLASGAFTIAYSGNLVPGYRQIKADVTVATMSEVIGLVKDFNWK